MAKRRVNADYPTPDAIRRTIVRPQTSLAGARRFLASQGMVVFADQKTGLARAAGDVWLLPSAVRRLGNYLDMGQTAISGFTIASHPQVSQMPGVAPARLVEAVQEVAESSRGVVVDPERQIKLASCSRNEDGVWNWRGTLTYEHTYSLAGGERIVSESDVPVMLREAPSGDAELAVIIRRPEDFSVASKWLHSGLEPNRNAWLAEPISLSSDAKKREEQVASILSGFTVGRLLKVSSPDIDKRELTTEETTKGGDKFLEIMKRAQYRTTPTDLDVIADRVAQDSGLLSGLTALIWTNESMGAKRKAIVTLRLKQRPGRDNHFELSWTAGRNYVDRDPPDVSDEQMPDLTAVDWDTHEKQGYMLEAFADVAQALTGTVGRESPESQSERSEETA